MMPCRRAQPSSTASGTTPHVVSRWSRLTVAFHRASRVTRTGVRASWHLALTSRQALESHMPDETVLRAKAREVIRAGKLPNLSLAKTPAGSQVVDLSALIRRESRFDDPSPAPRASTPALPLRRPPPARSREPRLAPATRRLQAKGDPASTTQN